MLLRYYEISFTAREKLLEFIKENAHRIVISAQVQKEFIRNREDSIQEFYTQVTEQLLTDYDTSLPNHLTWFTTNKKEILNDYPSIKSELDKWDAKLKSIREKLANEVNQQKKKPFDIITNDEYLDVVLSCQTIGELVPEELSVIKKHFDDLAKDLLSEKEEAIANNPSKAFPGAGDIKKKLKNPYGDFIIYHEMMKFMIENNADAIFLTFDRKKHDWMKKEPREPYLHYVTNMYANTNHLLYIIDADRTLADILNVNIASLVSTATVEENGTPITLGNLRDLFATDPIFIQRKKDVLKRYVDELRRNGFTTMEQITKDLKRGNKAFLAYEKDREKRFYYVAMGLVRATMRILYPEYTALALRDGVLVEEQSNWSQYEKYAHLVEKG